MIETKKETQIPDEPPCQRDLSIDYYKKWLTKYYDIKKNKILGQFICQDKLFDNINSALKYADLLERDKLKKYLDEEQKEVGQDEEQKEVGQDEEQKEVGQDEEQKEVDQDEEQKEVDQDEEQKEVDQLEEKNLIIHQNSDEFKRKRIFKTKIIFIGLLVIIFTYISVYSQYKINNFYQIVNKKYQEDINKYNDIMEKLKNKLEEKDLIKNNKYEEFYSKIEKNKNILINKLSKNVNFYIKKDGNDFEIIIKNGSFYYISLLEGDIVYSCDNNDLEKTMPASMILLNFKKKYKDNKDYIISPQNSINIKLTGLASLNTIDCRNPYYKRFDGKILFYDGNYIVGSVSFYENKSEKWYLSGKKEIDSLYDNINLLSQELTKKEIELNELISHAPVKKLTEVIYFENGWKSWKPF